MIDFKIDTLMIKRYEFEGLFITGYDYKAIIVFDSDKTVIFSSSLELIPTNYDKLNKVLNRLGFNIV